MNRSQGRYFTREELDRIISLLQNTDMSMADIASRMRCSRSAINAVNGRFRIRQYDGRRNHWILGRQFSNAG
ncbi:MAG TPA: hypothetical protein VFY29_05425 [Terriglobia bacterium]|nr:hypothetical protein [Terriglobia bacterium]